MPWTVVRWLVWSHLLLLATVVDMLVSLLLIGCVVMLLFVCLVVFLIYLVLRNLTYA